MSFSSPSALIFGVTGQDGYYLSKFLFQKGYTVYGATRGTKPSRLSGNMSPLSNGVQLHSYGSSTVDEFLTLIEKLNPSEIYYLAGQTSVGASFNVPIETFASIQAATLNLLEAIRLTRSNIRLYNAGSSEAFGNTSLDGATEETSFRPKSPYAVAKAAAAWTVRCYRDSYHLFASTGLLFNHESPRRGSQFVTGKILATARSIAQGDATTLELGDLSIVRDWGWAEEYVEAMWLMLQQPEPDDYVIATGKGHSLEQLVQKIFAGFGLEWSRYVRINKDLFRPNELRLSVGNPSKARRILGWSAQTSLDDIVCALCESALKGSDWLQSNSQRSGLQQ